MPTSATPVQIVDDNGKQITSFGGSGTAASPSVTTEYGSNNINTTQAPANTGTASLLIAARAGRKAVTIENLTGTQKAWLGNAGVTNGTGFLLPAAVGASVTIPTAAAIYGISDTAAQTVAILETY